MKTDTFRYKQGWCPAQGSLVVTRSCAVWGDHTHVASHHDGGEVNSGDSLSVPAAALLFPKCFPNAILGSTPRSK